MLRTEKISFETGLLLFVFLIQSAANFEEKTQICRTRCQTIGERGEKRKGCYIARADSHKMDIESRVTKAPLLYYRLP
jgi:hypothetical protein